MTFDIKKVAHLARIAVSAEESQVIEEKLSNLMSMIDQLQQVDTGGIEPLTNPLHIDQRFRPDQVTEKDHCQLYQKNAPAVAADLYLVPQVIE